jgi:hypothetical protein
LKAMSDEMQVWAGVGVGIVDWCQGVRFVPVLCMFKNISRRVTQEAEAETKTETENSEQRTESREKLVGKG